MFAVFAVIALGQCGEAVDLGCHGGGFEGLGDDGVAGLDVVAAVRVIHPPEAASEPRPGIDGWAREYGDLTEAEAFAFEDPVQLRDDADLVRLADRPLPVGGVRQWTGTGTGANTVWLMSTIVLPALSPAMRPSAPSATPSSAAESVTITKITSAA